MKIGQLLKCDWSISSLLYSYCWCRVEYDSIATSILSQAFKKVYENMFKKVYENIFFRKQARKRNIGLCIWFCIHIHANVSCFLILNLISSRNNISWHNICIKFCIHISCDIHYKCKKRNTTLSYSYLCNCVIMSKIIILYQKNVSNL